jgi:putative heme transporter
MGADAKSGGPTPASRIGQIALTLVVVYLVFFHVLPGIADWDEVADTLRDVAVIDVVLIVLISIGIEVVKASEQWLILPRLRLVRAFVALEVASLVGNLVPASTTATRYGVYRSWGLSSSDFARGWLVSSAFNNFIVLVAPVLGMAYLLIATDTEAPTWLLWATGIAAVVAAVVAVVVILAFRSEHLARRIGALMARAIRWLRGKLKRPSAEDVQAAVVQFREDAIVVMRNRGGLLLLVILGKFLATSLLLWFTLYVVGVPASVIGYGEVFAVYAFVRLLTVVQLTPGSIGIADALYVGGLVGVAGDQGEAYHNDIVAAVVLFRAATYALPIVLGLPCALVWKARKSWRAQPSATPEIDRAIGAAVGRQVDAD